MILTTIQRMTGKKIVDDRLLLDDSDDDPEIDVEEDILEVPESQII